MATKKKDPSEALVAVVKALEDFSDPERLWVLQSAANRWSLAPPVSSPSFGGAVPSGNVTGSVLSNKNGDAQQAIARKDARSFIRIKRPATDVQRVACLGYFVLQTTGQQGFSSKEVAQANVNSGSSKINLTRALDNATRQSKYLSSRGGNSKQLTTLGEDVVDALPDQQAVDELEAAVKGRGKSKGRRKRKSKKA